MSNLLGIREAALRLGVNVNTLRKWDKSGQLKAVRIGPRRDRRYRPEDIEAFIKERNG